MEHPDDLSIPHLHACYREGRHTPRGVMLSLLANAVKDGISHLGRKAPGQFTLNTGEYVRHLIDHLLNQMGSISQTGQSGRPVKMAGLYFQKPSMRFFSS